MCYADPRTISLPVQRIKFVREKWLYYKSSRRDRIQFLDPTRSRWTISLYRITIYGASGVMESVYLCVSLKTGMSPRTIFCISSYVLNCPASSCGPDLHRGLPHHGVCPLRPPRFPILLSAIAPLSFCRS